MVKFDKDGKIIRQVIKIKTKHEENHSRLYNKIKSDKNDEILENWLDMYFEKKISKTEMYFIISLEKEFNIKRIKSSIILDALMNKEIVEINCFVKRKQGYSLNIYNSSYILFTPKLYFEVDSQKEDILKFMKQELKQIN